MRLEGRVAIVTGGGGGIGSAIAAGAGREGARVVVVDVDEAGAKAAADAIAASGAEALAMRCDVASASQVGALVDAVAARFGRIDIVANIAGVFPRSAVTEMGEDEWDRVMSINLKSAFLMCRAAVPHMVRENFGRIVNITSGLAVRGAARGAHYAASKAGVMAFTASLAQEVAAYDINVNAIAPGITDTKLMRDANRSDEIDAMVKKMTRSRLGQPEDVVEPFLFLVTDAGRVMTGEVLWLRSA